MASSIAAALLSYYTIAQVDGLLADKLGVTEAASALQIAVRFPDDGGADEVVAAIGEQILGPTDVSLSNWTVRPSSGCSVVLATHTAGAVSVDGYTLTLAANPWNIVRTYNLTPGRELLFACRYRLTASNFVVYMSEADNVYDPLYGSFVGDQGAWSTAKMYFTVPPNGVAKLQFGATSRRRACPTASPAPSSARPRRVCGARRAWTSRCRRAESQSCTSEPSVQQSAGTLDLYSMQIRASALGDVSTGTLTASGAATAASFAATGALTGATLTIAGAASAGPLDCESLDCTFTATSGGVSTGSVVCGDVTSSGTVSAAALRLQHAHRDQHLRLLGRSLPDEELGGLEQAADLQQQCGLRQRAGAAAAGQPERQGLPGAGRRDAPVRAHHDQR